MSTPASMDSGAVKPEQSCTYCGGLLPASARSCGHCGQLVIKDFFISYNQADQGWAEWIAWCLEAMGYTTIIQAWDIRPGSNFIVEMDQGFKSTHRTIAVLSPDYLTSQYTVPEWADALRRDPTGTKRLLVPIRVRPCEPQGWLAAIVYIDLLGLPQEEAQKRLLESVKANGRPETTPAYPRSSAPAYPAPVISIWQVPYRRNPYFTGREDMLVQLRSTFTIRQGVVTQALTGLGGIGKTQTVLEYAFRYQQDYHAIFWMQAETHELLIGSIIQTATLLELKEREAQEQEVIVAAMRHWLEMHPGWLLILDNLEDATLAEMVLPTHGSGHVLLTTRAQAPGAFDRTTPLSELPQKEAIRFLLRRANLLELEAPLVSVSAERQTQAFAIVEALGNLTLALDQAGAYIEETGCGLVDYLALFQSRRVELLNRRGEFTIGHPESVAVTWAIAFEQVQQINPAAADLLRLCAFLHPEAIPEDIIHVRVEELPPHYRERAEELPYVFRRVVVLIYPFLLRNRELTPDLQRAVKDPFQWNAAISTLRRFSLIDRQAETRTLSLHRLVQAVLQDDLSALAWRAWAERAIRLVSRAFPNPPDFVNWERCQQVLPHAIACTSWIEQWHLPFAGTAASLLTRAGYYLNERARYTEALSLYQEALKMTEQEYSSTHPNVATGLNNLAELYRTLGRYREALPLFQRALAIREKVLRPTHPHVAFSLNNLALLYLAQEQYEEALPLLQRALAIRERVLGPTHPDVAMSLNNLATLYRSLKQHGEAIPLLQQALVIYEQVQGPNHPNIATSLDNLAVLYSDLGQYGEALPLYRRALAIREEDLGPNHPDVAMILNNLAVLYNDLGQYGEAIRLLRRALAIYEQVLPDHPTIATILDNLADLLRKIGQEREARELEETAQAIRTEHKKAHE